MVGTRVPIGEDKDDPVLVHGDSGGVLEPPSVLSGINLRVPRLQADVSRKAGRGLPLGGFG
jgi:hypothetical protein